MWLVIPRRAHNRRTVPRERVTEICREVLGRFPVTDLNVQEPEIEDVIRQLFAAAP